MLATAMTDSFISINVRRNMRKVVTVLAVLLAVIFILRGLELGIPFISPKLQKMAVTSIEKVDDAQKESCCQPDI